MGKNRPIVNVTEKSVIRPHGVYGVSWYLFKYVVFSSILSFVATQIWNVAVRNVFGMAPVTFFEAWGIFALISITVVALNGLSHLGISPNSRL